jgi:hypothetical protein
MLLLGDGDIPNYTAGLKFYANYLCKFKEIKQTGKANIS